MLLTETKTYKQSDSIHTTDYFGELVELLDNISHSHYASNLEFKKNGRENLTLMINGNSTCNHGRKASRYGTTNLVWITCPYHYVLVLLKYGGVPDYNKSWGADTGTVGLWSTLIVALLTVLGRWKAAIVSHPLPHIPILGSSSSAANKDMVSKILTNGGKTF